MDIWKLNEIMVKNFKAMQEQINDLNSRICALAEAMNVEAEQSITDQDIAMIEAEQAITDLDIRVMELEIGG